MTLLAQLKTDQLSARKAREVTKASLLTTLIGEASIVGKNDGNRESTDAEVTAVIKKFIKNIDETLKVAPGNTVAKEEKSILEIYLPSQMSESELLNAISGLDKNKGLIMKHLKDNFAGKYDGRLAAQVVDTFISA